MASAVHWVHATQKHPLMALEWFNREDGHGGSWLYIVQEQQQGDGESLVLEQDTGSINASLPERKATGCRATFKIKETQIHKHADGRIKRGSDKKCALRVIYLRVQLIQRGRYIHLNVLLSSARARLGCTGQKFNWRRLKTETCGGRNRPRADQDSFKECRSVINQSANPFPGGSTILIRRRLSVF